MLDSYVTKNGQITIFKEFRHGLKKLSDILDPLFKFLAYQRHRESEEPFKIKVFVLIFFFAFKALSEIFRMSKNPEEDFLEVNNAFSSFKMDFKGGELYF